MVLVPAVREAAQLWEPSSAPQGTAQGTVGCLLRRKPPVLNSDVGLEQQSLRSLSVGALQDAMSGGEKAAATIQFVEGNGERRVNGLTSWQVTE